MRFAAKLAQLLRLGTHLAVAPQQADTMPLTIPAPEPEPELTLPKLPRSRRCKRYDGKGRRTHVRYPANGHQP